MFLYNKKHDKYIIFLVILLSSLYNCQKSLYECNRQIYEAKGPKKIGNNGFYIEITGKNDEKINDDEGFIPGMIYKITLKGRRTEYTVQTFRGFGITTLYENDKNAGKFEISKKRGEVRIAPNCRKSGVSHTNLRPKTSVSVLWRAPNSGDGCVLLRATIIESRNIWYADDSLLTLKFCAKKTHESAIPEDNLNAKCCACTEAKYDIEFLGIWSKETHPKEYPSLEHLTHFTDFLGASHSNNYTLWKFGEIASDGLKEIAEWGNTFKAENEMKDNAREIRTIIKLKGLWFPEVQGQTKSSFHVNKVHHFTSLAAMFGPSPDWCVGISGINLCLPDCTWVEERVFDLLPWDAGTDDGVTYMSPNVPAEPRHKIVPITTKTNKLSPFYNEFSDEIPPLGRLTIKRTNVINTGCRNDEEYKKEAFEVTSISEEEEYKDRRECLMSEWESWSLCSATCGKGVRMRSRVFQFPIKAQMFNCHRQTTERQFCSAKQTECHGSDLFSTECTTTNWEDWSSCSVTCGVGQRKRNRKLLDETKIDNCKKINLTDVEDCIGENGEDCNVTPNPLCKTTSWSEWSPCSASCDDGIKIRSRLFYYVEHELQCTNINLIEKAKCQMPSCRRLLTAHSEEICNEDKAEGQCGGVFPRYWYNSNTSKCERFIYTGCKGNRNQFETEKECKQLCVKNMNVDKVVIPGHQLIGEFGGEDTIIEDGGERVDCILNEWSPWSECSTTCGRGKRTRNKSIKVFPRNGGTPCPSGLHLIQERKCDNRPCESKGCRLGNWGMWSRCSQECDGIQFRRRRIFKSRNYIDNENDPNCYLPESEERKCNENC
ncbi:Thrombospondin, type 1 repeat and Proteinase inhibitor I2, Kunitz metazoa domain and Reeler domain and Spondin, N-terminal domain-containing protein [Strongyloides ratti]|uniref:Spondin-1 n=1 Tax=Strongyloides ratti TaxID=34506 RepID=A0A090LRP8_STRRB|nr:Thrombospondin, type 1 repeat and Proteinase inhibitor I2, Kunitz metazoa domain and Reeler domain and Spondin, N-terminal domain-containing protein [Strongyloides ratti]CEF70857.1 Thrombospondin, type 1 repeat and Proteinase inhibitor I2, Kunitz metazoa domain and Reeler domain and Spondin, N-terminal domain-containing protein [Strongyloides ratti]